MTYFQFRALLDELRLSQLAAARLLGADARTVRRWALGERSVPPTVGVLLQLLADDKIAKADITAAQEEIRKFDECGEIDDETWRLAKLRAKPGGEA